MQCLNKHFKCYLPYNTDIRIYINIEKNLAGNEIGFENNQTERYKEKMLERKTFSWPCSLFIEFNSLEILSIPDNDLEQNLNKGIWALWENLEGCKAS